MELKTIKCTLQDYAQAYCYKDINAMMHIFGDSDNISVIGTGADELFVGRDEVKKLFLRNFNEATANKFEWNWIDIRISENHAFNNPINTLKQSPKRSYTLDCCT